MTTAWALLFASRKFWVGFLTIVSVIAVVVLRVTDKIPGDALVPTLSAVTALGLGVIGSIAWEDVAEKRAGGAPESPAPPSAPTPPSVVAADVIVVSTDAKSEDVPATST